MRPFDLDKTICDHTTLCRCPSCLDFWKVVLEKVNTGDIKLKHRTLWKSRLSRPVPINLREPS